MTTDYFRSKCGTFYVILEIALAADESMVNVYEDPRVITPSQLVTRVIYVEETCYLDRRAHQIWHVRRKLILGICLIILPVLAFIKVSTVAWHTCIKNKFGSIIVI